MNNLVFNEIKKNSFIFVLPNETYLSGKLNLNRSLKSELKYSSKIGVISTMCKVQISVEYSLQ